MAAWGFLAGAALNYLGGQDTNATNVQLAQDTSAFNAAQAQANRDWQEWQTKQARDYDVMMSNSAVQRRVSDLQLAGLNPMLAYNSQASSPQSPMGSGSSATGVAASVGNSMGAAVNGGFQGARVVQELEQSKAQTENINAQADLARSQALINAVTVPKVQQETRTSASSASQLEALTQKVGMERNLIGAQIPRTVAEGELADARRQSIDRENQAGAPEARVRKLVADTELAAKQAILTSIMGSAQGLQLPRLRNEANAQSSWWMRNVSPYLPDVLKSSSSAAGFSKMMK